jgi:serine/threonine protein kinase
MGSPAFEPQRVLAGRYRLEQRLGAGGMGAIWRAEHLTLQAPVAVKIIDRDAVRDEQTVARFLREAKAAASLRSPHVVQILDYGVDEGVPFIVMELLEGETLAERLKRNGRLTPAETARFMTHVGRAIGRAHDAGIVHRDLKPENVFIVHNEDDEIAKVLDFGVAKVEGGQLAIEGEKTRTGSILGTPYYMSPEQAQGNKAVDYRSDLWSVGVMAFECMTGTRPFYSEGLGDLVLSICVRELPVPSDFASVPPGFDAWFAQAIERDPERRFQSAREMTDALREALGIESRDPISTATPELVVSSRPERGPARLETSAVSARAEVTTPRGDVRTSPSHADPIAATLAYQPARVEAERGPTLPEPEPSSSGGLGTVVAVAALALALGLGGGVYALMIYGKDLPALRGLRGERPQTIEQQDDSARRVDAVGAGALTAAPTPSVTPPTASASASQRAAQPAASRERRESAENNAAVDAGAPRSAVKPDGGWVKPAWAIPDPEPRRADDLDEPRDR